MCYSAVVDHDLALIAQQAKARLDLDMFVDLFKRRALGENISSPKLWKQIF